MADSRPHQAELGVAGAPEDRAEDPGAAGSLVRDYATVFKMMSPSYSGEGLTPLQCARLLPLATGVQFFWVVLFMIVELSAGAGGTSGVAGTRTVMLFFVYLLLIPIALLISRAAAAGSLRNSGLVLAYALVASSMLAAMLGSSMSTFGVEKCRGSATLGPLFPDVTSAVQTPVVQADSPAGSETGTGTGTGTAWLTETGTGTGTADEESEDTADEDSEDEADATSVVSGGLYMGRTRCGIDSLRRGSKIVFEFFFSLIFGLPSLIVSFSLLLSAQAAGPVAADREMVSTPNLTGDYVVAQQSQTRNGLDEQQAVPLHDPGDMMSPNREARELAQLQKQEAELKQHASELKQRNDQLHEHLESKEKEIQQMKDQYRQQLDDEIRTLHEEKQQHIALVEKQQEALRAQQHQQQEEQMRRDRREAELEQELRMQRQQSAKKPEVQPLPSLAQNVAPAQQQEPVVTQSQGSPAAPGPKPLIRVGTVHATKEMLEKQPTVTYSMVDTRMPGAEEEDLNRSSSGVFRRSPSPTGSVRSTTSAGSRTNGSQVRSEARAVRDRARAALGNPAAPASSNTQQYRPRGIEAQEQSRLASADAFRAAPAMINGTNSLDDDVDDPAVDAIINQYLDDV